ncbi:MAG: chemotaxis protein CheC [Candidatus Omnitrophica bacterium]|nr:chemotaxis protein CheC [Candidatus Omnitrophota bacterium]
MHKPDELQVLRDIGRKAADKAGLALSEILDKKIFLHHSFGDIVDVRQMHQHICLKMQNVGVVIFIRLYQGLYGELIFALDERTAYNLVNLSKFNYSQDAFGLLTEMGVSVLKETGNMVLGSYLTVLSDILKLAIPPSLAVFMSGTLEQIFSDVLYYPYFRMEHLQRYVIQTDFEVFHENIKGNISLALNPEFRNELVKRAMNSGK